MKGQIVKRHVDKTSESLLVYTEVKSYLYSKTIDLLQNYS